MGIKGLLNYLTVSCSDILVNEEVLPKNSTLVIDGNGFMFYLLSLTKVENSFSRELGGNYNILNEAIKEEIQHYLNNGLKVQVFFDGRSRMKEETTKKRLLERMNEWTCLYNACNDGEKLKQDKIPIPPLVSTQIKMTLGSIPGVQIIYCDEEADQEIAKICYKNNINLDKGKELFYCYGNDSDFIAMKECPYIKFYDLIIKNNEVKARKIWRRSEVSTFLEMSEQQFIELCIYIGNDYTKKFDRSNFISVVDNEDDEDDDNCNDDNDDVDEDDNDDENDITNNDSKNDGNKRKVAKNKNSPEYIDELKDDLISRGDGYQLETNDKNLQQAIDFSRALYELQNLTSFPLTCENIDSREESEEEEENMSLNKEQKKLLCDIYDHHGINSEVTANTVIQSLSIALETNSSIFNTITSMHLEAFTMMANELKNKDSKYSYNSIDKFPSWKDIFASHVFQLCSSHQIKYIKNTSSLSLLNINSPDNLYSGSLFHSCLNHLKEIESNNNKKIIINEIVADVEVIEVKSNILPIDLHKDEILRKISSDRVIIIHGETGCGKSSRLPVMLYEEAQRLNNPCKMMVSQPRRIAASSLMKRVRDSIGDKVGMRMGHGIREETENSCIYFVTTGYLVRLLAHNPEQFANHTHLIIDEVHERSIDGDLLCLLSRNLLEINKNIKIILMSATIHTALYKDYFSTNNEYYGDMECLSVGVRRFPLDIKYLEDLTTAGLPPQLKSAAYKLIKLSSNCTGEFEDMIPSTMAKEQYSLVISLIRSEGVLGSGILVFVSGIADITELSEKLENLPRYKVFAIHSDIPFEEQEAAFTPCGPNEVKVVIATNAAESSITLPDVDCVICLGTHKAIKYNVQSHRIQLVNTWISKASSTQRAGRTGRVRPGKVFRLYSNKLYNKFQEHEISEVLRTPLQDVILNLRVMFEDASWFDGVKPLLSSLLEPPEMDNVDKSFIYLHNANMITSEDDDGLLTAIGKFAGKLPIDLQLSRLVALGITLDIGAEAIIIAMAITQPKSLFRIATPLIHRDPDYFNDIMRNTLISSTILDDKSYSEPVMYLRAYVEYMSLSYKDRAEFCRYHSLVESRFKHFVMSTENLLHCVNRERNKNNAITFDNLSLDGIHMKMNMIRLLLTWTCDGNFIRMNTPKIGSISDINNILIQSPVLSKEHFTNLFADTNINWKFDNIGKYVYNGSLSESRKQCTLDNLVQDLVVASYGSNNSSKVPLIWIHDHRSSNNNKIKDTIIIIRNIFENNDTENNDITNGLSALFKPGKLEKISELHNNETWINKYNSSIEIYMCKNPSKSDIRNLKSFCNHISMYISMSFPSSESKENSIVICSNFNPSKEAIARVFFSYHADDALELSIKQFSYELSPNELEEIKKYRISEQITGTKQILSFDNNEESKDINKDLELDSNNKKIKKNSSFEKENDPLDNNNKFDYIDDLPFGCKLINSIRQGYKNKKMQLWKNVRNVNNQTQANIDLINHSNVPVHVVGSVEWSLAKLKQESEKNSNNNNNDDDFDEDKIEVNSSIISSNWKYFNVSNSSTTSSMMALLGRQTLNSVSMHCGNDTLYGVAQNILEIGGRGSSMMCVERTTLLPLGSRWLSLALLCMNLNPDKIIVSQNSKKFINSPITSSDYDFCEEIKNEIFESCNNKIEENEYLVGIINELFCEWNENNHIQLLKRLQNPNSNNYFINQLQFKKSTKHDRIKEKEINEEKLLNSPIKISPNLSKLVPSNLLTKKKLSPNKTPIPIKILSRDAATLIPNHPELLSTSQVNLNDNSNNDKSSVKSNRISRSARRTGGSNGEVKDLTQSPSPSITNYKSQIFDLLQKYYQASFKIGVHLIYEVNQNEIGEFQTIIILTDFKTTGENNIFVGDYFVKRKDSEQHSYKLAFLNNNVKLFYRLPLKTEKKELKKANKIDVENNVVLEFDKKTEKIKSSPIFHTGMAILSKNITVSDNNNNKNTSKLIVPSRLLTTKKSKILTPIIIPDVISDDDEDDEDIIDFEMANIIANMNLNSDDDDDDDDDDVGSSDVEEYEKNVNAFVYESKVNSFLDDLIHRDQEYLHKGLPSLSPHNNNMPNVKIKKITNKNQVRVISSIKCKKCGKKFKSLYCLNIHKRDTHEK